MPTASTIRRLGLDAERQSRMKARVNAWWHTERCPKCASEREGSMPARIIPLGSLRLGDFDPTQMLERLRKELAGVPHEGPDEPKKH